MKKITIDSLMDIRFMSQPKFSPNGSYIAYVTSKQNKEKNTYESFIHILKPYKNWEKQLTFTGKESSYIWEDDHTLLFASERSEEDKAKKAEEKTCFYRLDVEGGEAQKAMTFDKTVTDILKCGKGYLLTVREDLNRLSSDVASDIREEELDYHVVEEIPFWANGHGYVSRLRSALYLFDPEANSLKKITPTFFDVESVDVNDTSILYTGVCYQDVRPEYGQACLYDLESGETKALLPENTYSVGPSVFLEDSVVLPLSTMKEYGNGQNRDLYRYYIKNGQLNLVAKLNVSIGPNVLSDCVYGSGKSIVSSGYRVIFITQHEYHSDIMEFTSDNILTTAHSFEGSISAIDVALDYMCFVGQAPNRTSDLYGGPNEEIEKFTDINRDFFETHQVAEAKSVAFEHDGHRIDGWVLEPETLEGAPAVLEIHGGPRCAYGTVFFHEMQALVSEGYLVFFCNPRGSDGYGEEFSDIRGKYGDVDYKDLMAFTDHVLSLYPMIDKQHIGVAGGSYGGFMCNWIEGHTDRFAAICSQRSVSNWVSDFGVSEIGVSFDSNEMAATPWDGMERMWNQSPLKYAHNAKTPILFIHSLCDYNCPVDQGAQMFTAMKYFSVPTRMCLFEGENHSLSRSGKPKHRLRRLREIMNWFNQYLKVENR